MIMSHLYFKQLKVPRKSTKAITEVLTLVHLFRILMQSSDASIFERSGQKRLELKGHAHGTADISSTISLLVHCFP